MNINAPTIAQIRQFLLRIGRSAAHPSGPSSSATVQSPAPLGPASLRAWSTELIARMDWRQLERVVVALFGAEHQHVETIGNASPTRDCAGNAPSSETSLILKRATSPGKTGDGKLAHAPLVAILTHRGVRRALFLKLEEDSAVLPSSLDAAALVQYLLKLTAARRDALLTLATEGDWSTPSCPTCNLKMQKLKGGNHHFWGCQNFPKCPQTSDIG
jgi:restriction system protein